MSESSFEVIIGTYEQFVLGYKFIKSDKEQKLVNSFANHSHQGTVKSVATSGKWLVSSSSDETIHIYDLDARKECGQIFEQNGTITSLCFTPDSSYLISASEDGSIALFKVGTWVMEKLWSSAHKKKGVTNVAVHPSGKMALSLGKDQSLRTWNLVKGRPAYTTNLSRCTTTMEFVVWSPNGTYYAIPMNTTLELFSVSSAGVSQVYKFKTKITSAVFISDKVLCVGEESGEVSSQCVETGLELWRFSGEKRVRGIAVHKKFLVTGCSNGTVTVYEMSSPAESPTLVTSISAGCRLTCLTIYVEDKRKRKHKKNEDGELESSSNTKISELLSNKFSDKGNRKRKGKRQTNEDGELQSDNIKRNRFSVTKANGTRLTNSSNKSRCSPNKQNWFVQTIDKVKE